MLERIKNKARLIRDNLTKLNHDSMGKSTLLVVIFLDVFILMAVFQGLADNTNQLTKPTEYIPKHCRDIIIDADWHQDSRLETVARISNSWSRYIYLPDRVKPEHPLCMPISTLMKAIKDDRALTANLQKFLQLGHQLMETGTKLEYVSDEYDTYLLGTNAEQNLNRSNAATLQQKVSELTNRLSTLVRKESELQSLLRQNESIDKLFKIIDASQETDRETLVEDLRYLNFWYPIKRLGMEMIFLLPLIVIFYFWNSKSIAAHRPYQTLVSAHLLVIAFIPAFFKVAELIYDIIPKKLLQQTFEWLMSFKLIAIWHYLTIAVGISAALAFIYLLQNKIFSREKLIQKRIAKGLCQACGVHFPSEHHACSKCGFKQFRQCNQCNQMTYVYGKYCRECGASE